MTQYRAAFFISADRQSEVGSGVPGKEISDPMAEPAKALKRLLPAPPHCPTVEYMADLFALVERACEQRERASLDTVRPNQA